MKKKETFYFCLLFLFTVYHPTFAQVQQISGQVVAADGTPLAGVSVSREGSSDPTTTNSEGVYQIDAQQSTDFLLFSLVGYERLRIKANDLGSLQRIVMRQQVQELDEVIAIGYASVKKSDLTGSVASIKAKEINAYPAASVMQALSGRAAGVEVKSGTGAPGSSVNVRIRGANSIQGSNEPLYVIDGFPANNALAINNADIQNIEILKDASAVAIYGSRGANGVVLITTKSGQEGRTRVNLESSYGTQALRKKLDLMNAREYAEFYNLQRKNDGQEPYFSEEEINGFNEGFDWQDFVYQNAPIQNHSLTISGGNAKTQFSLSGSVFGQKGIIRKSDYNRYSLRTNINHQISEKFRAGVSAVLSRNQTSRQNSSGARFGASLISASLVTPPTLTPYNEDGTYRVFSSIYPFVSEGLTNPLNFINEIKDRALSNKVLTNAFIAYEPIEGLVLKIQGGVESSDDRSDYYRTLGYFNSQGNATVSTSQFVSLLNENTVSYTRTFNKHHLVALGGFTFQNFSTTSLGGSGTGFLSDATESYNLGSAAIPGIPSSGYTESALLSYLGRLNYTFDNRILATVSFRSDGSSKYSKGNKWGFFPSAALAWRLTEETFLQDQSFISDLKLRASWGRTGSQAINAYATLNQLAAGKTVFADALYNTFAPGTRLPGNLKWETTEQTDFGIDFAFLQNRFRITADYYNKLTNDLLNTVQLPSSMGFTSTIRNVGQIRNRGVEFTADASILNGPFQWNVNGNLSFNRSKVIKLYGGQDILSTRIDMLVFADDATLLREGQPMGVFYGYMEDGYDENGNIQYKDLNQDGAINLNDKTIIGNPNPDFTYGLNSNMSYKGFDLGLFLQGSSGNDLVNVSSVGNTLHYGYGNNMLKEVYYNHWTPETPNAKYPRISRSQTLNFSDRFVENGSFLRLKNIELGYTLPFNKQNVGWIQNIRIYVSAQNLLTFTNYSWWDPEVNSLGGGLSQGVDYSTYPVAKTYLAGINVEF